MRQLWPSDTGQHDYSEMTLAVAGLGVERSGNTLLHPTSLAIESGEKVGLVGASGSGKSTLGHALVDTLRIQDVSVAHVPQSPDEALDPLRSMAFHWQEAESACAHRVDTQRQQQLFSALKIENGDLRKRPWGWSRGMQQRFVIAMALIGAPQLLVLDEPTSALDPLVAARAMNLLNAVLKEHNTAMLLITHDLGLAARRVNRLVVMHNGRIVENAPTTQLLDRPVSAAAIELVRHRSWLTIPC